MKQKLAEWPDFKNEPTLLMDLHVKMAGIYWIITVLTMIYAPKFHCELQEKIERAWQHSKAYCAKFCTHSITGK